MAVSHLNAYLDDYAYLANALLEMLQVRWRNEDVTWCAKYSRRDARALRRPDQLGGFFFTSDDHEALIHRSKRLSATTRSRRAMASPRAR